MLSALVTVNQYRELDTMEDGVVDTENMSRLEKESGGRKNRRSRSKIQDPILNLTGSV
jgi:hypothetical protein